MALFQGRMKLHAIFKIHSKFKHSSRSVPTVCYNPQHHLACHHHRRITIEVIPSHRHIIFTSLSPSCKFISPWWLHFYHIITSSWSAQYPSWSHDRTIVALSPSTSPSQNSSKSWTPILGFSSSLHMVFADCGYEYIEYITKDWCQTKMQNAKWENNQNLKFLPIWRPTVAPQLGPCDPSSTHL